MADRDAGNGEDGSLSPQDEVPTAPPRSKIAAEHAAGISQDEIPTAPLGHSKISLESSAAPGDSAANPAKAPSPSTARPKSSGYDETLDGQVATPQAGTEMPLDQWELYEILGLLGKGGMGMVYRARDRRLGRMVALKFIRGDDTVLVQRLKQEARAQASIEHPHVCKVYDVGEFHGQAYIAMQFIDGQPLSVVHHEMTQPDKVLTMALIAEAVHAAHRQGIIHRDLKPSNVMMERTADGRFHPYVLDFGVAHDANAGYSLTQTGALLGTPQYMSPEQARSETKKIDRRSDVYSLGAMFYELLTGEPPVQGESLTDILLQVLDNDPRPLRQLDPSLPIALETVTLKCLQKEPSARYDSAKALAEDLRRYLDDEPVHARRIGAIRRLYQKARRHKPLVALGIALLASLLGLVGYGVRTRLEARSRERLAQRQAELAKRLGQEIKDMEWLLRSSRQLQLHDLEREKSIVRHRMAKLQRELAGYGDLSRAIAHYALGRGHLALHEYPQALTELRAALALGYKDSELHYALGLVLGKHFEQAIYEARLSGGGDWAKKQLKDLEPSFLFPAIASLRVSRAMMRDSPEYLDGLIAYYQRDYDGALNKAQAALRDAPWLYEAAKLQGDVHLERALQARDAGRDGEAEREFASAVSSYEAAAAEGRSDGEVYEGLAEAWVRQIEMAVRHGQSAEAAYAKAVAASDKLTAAEPQSVAGPLKKASASIMTMSLLSSSLSSTERVRQCRAAADVVLAKQPENPYAQDAAASCYLSAVEVARQHGEDPEPLLRQAVSLLESATKQYPHFLWGINDLGNAYFTLGIHLQLHGAPGAREMIEKSLQAFLAAAALDPAYLAAPANALGALAVLTPEVQSMDELQGVLSRADRNFASCITINKQEANCYDNYFQSYARAANRELFAGKDPQPSLQRALENLALTRKLSNQLIDAEQHAALAHLVQARDLVLRKEDPTTALEQIKNDLVACFGIAAQDVVCRTLAAQAEWVDADWQASRNLPSARSLNAALTKALLATQSPEPYPDAWQTLAATYLRLARGASPKQRALHIAKGLGATQRLFAMNPHHALGLATHGELLLLRADTESDLTTRQQTARVALQALQEALKRDSFLSHTYAPLLQAAQTNWGDAANDKQY